MVLQGLSGGHGVMDSRREGALSSVMAVSTIGLPIVMGISAMIMDQRLMALMASEVGA
jgi:hypothetical protein